MSSGPNRRFAILVGIDLYDDKNPKKNLSGCINDINAVSSMLQSDFGIPSSNITMLTASAGSGSKIDFCRPGAPTKQNLVNAFDTLRKEKPCAFLYFHYSGHGGYRYTRWPKLKGPKGQDEVLCTWQEDFRDVELGERLDVLAKIHTVCAVLDCCHSGGADRSMPGEHEKKRWRGPRKQQPAYLDSKFDTYDSNEDLSSEERDCYEDDDDGDSSSSTDQSDDSDQGYAVEASANSHDGMRSAKPVKSQLYRKRDYNLIAAATPRQTATERLFLTGSTPTIHGALTHYLLDTLQEFRSSQYDATYGHLMSVIQAKIKAVPRNKINQTPLLIGDRDCVLFSTQVHASQSNLLANVTDVGTHTVNVNRGSANGVCRGDRFLAYPPEEVASRFTSSASTAPVANTNAVELKILQVQSLVSTAERTPPQSGQSVIKSGHFAKLLERSHAQDNQIRIDVKLSVNVSSYNLDDLRQQLGPLPSPLQPIDLNFDSARSSADYVVSIKDEIPDTPEMLIALLHHLCSYQRALRSVGQGSSQSMKYDLNLQQSPSLPPKGFAATWKLTLKNTGNRSFYISIFNLTPGYGIHQFHPMEQETCEEIGPDRERNLTINIIVPKYLKEKLKTEQKDLMMQDVMKVFITTRTADFRHYLLPDLKIDHFKKFEIERNQHGPLAVRSKDCAVHHLIIDTPLKTRKATGTRNTTKK